MGSELPVKFLIQVSVHLGSLLLPPLLAIAEDAFLENGREGLMNKILYADDLVLMNESIENLKEVFKMKRGV